MPPWGLKALWAGQLLHFFTSQHFAQTFCACHTLGSQYMCVALINSLIYCFSSFGRLFICPGQAGMRVHRLSRPGFESWLFLFFSCVTCLTSLSPRIRPVVVLWFIRKVYICSLFPFLALSSKTPGIFKVMISIKVSFAMSGESWKAPKVRGWLPGETPTSGEGRGTGDWVRLPVASGSVSYAYVMKPPQNPKRTGFVELLGWWTLGGAGRVALSERAG